MKLIVGLGNPGREYERTRHNVGFMAVDRLAQRHGLTMPRSRFQAAILDGQILRQRVMLMQPTTYMNRSGQAVGEAARYHDLAPEQVLVVVDEVALPLGTLRLRAKGSAGGHNGLADIERALQSDAYPRLRIGIGEPRIHDQPVRRRDYVLGRFTDEELAALAPTIDEAANAMETWLEQGTQAAMNKHNTPRAAARDEAGPEAGEEDRSESR